MLLASVMLLTLAVLATAVAAARSFSTIGIPFVAILLGMGNSLFHVWGGKQVATETGNDIHMLGAFVATGALGLSIGYVFFSWLLLCFLVLAISLLSVFYITIDKESIEATSRSTSTKHSFSTSLICLILLDSPSHWWGLNAGKDGRWMDCSPIRHHQHTGQRYAFGTCLSPMQKPRNGCVFCRTVCRELHNAHHTLFG